MTDDGKRSQHRTQTDTSLRTERENADGAVLARQVEAQHDADKVLQHARDTADAVLDAARERADDRLDATAPGAEIADERRVEDAVLRHERAAADEQLRAEREMNRQALLRLLPLEREKTDRYLLTERNRSDEDVAHRDEFLGIVSHDLRNLLSGIVLSADLIEKGASKGHAAERIHRYAARMNRLIGDLVDVASIDAGKLAVSPALGDTSALIDEVVDLFQGLARGRSVTFVAAAADPPLMAMFDHDRMVQVLANLVTNAIKFTPAGGTVTVSSERREGAVSIIVRDTGIGIAADKLDIVFERFWQAGSNDRRGLGLGLYISRCIVEAHGGTIQAESSPGAGTTIAVTLPA